MTDDLREKLEAAVLYPKLDKPDTVIRLNEAKRVARNHYEPLLEALRAENTKLREQLAETRLALLRKGTMPSVLNATDPASPSKPEKEEA